jgi:hypothetical protein
MYHFFDEPLGSHVDKYFLRESGINDILEMIEEECGISADIYTDKGLAAASHVIPAYRGALSPVEELSNYRISKMRVGHEWGHGKMYERHPFLKRVDKLKLQLVDVARYVRVAMILTNIHTCMRQSNMGLYFQCSAPTLRTWARPREDDAL